ncbi:hypothetical protein GGF31_000918 [Allomyces arbusculus]|nr:hypothetical protein GGF31_000918 [Allomyces arbusculus]
MPQIYIPLSSRNPRDLVLLELQGTLEGSGEDGADTSFAGETLGTIREWHVLGVVRHRYLFKSRPHNVV